MKNLLLKMCLVTTILVVACSTIILKFLWLARIGSLAHWSYLIGNALYPTDPSGSLILSASVFGFIALGTVVPTFLFPRYKFVATALSVPPQIHMLLLLHRNVTRRFENDAIGKSVQVYTAVTLVSTLWTIFSLLR